MMQRLAIIFTITGLLAGCATSPTPPAETPQTSQTPVTPPAATTTAPPHDDNDNNDANDGKYYLNDGPPANADTSALASIPDATVRWERIPRAQNSPYVALGKRYTPYRQLQQYRRQGSASWYGKRYHGRKTASGETYDMYKMTAAHPVLPIPSYARVTRVSNGESVIVRVNDRGPFLGGRIIDLSYAAAARLGYVKAGTAEVIVEQLIPANAPSSGVSSTAPDGTTVEVEDAPPPSGEIYIQLAAFVNRTAAEESAQLLKRALPPRLAKRVEVHQKAEDLYAVQVGPYATRADATEDDAIICKQYDYCGFLSRRQTK